MLLSIEGNEGTGKTTLAYTAPLPIVGFQFDLGEDRAIYGAKYQDYFEGLNIEIVEDGKESQRHDSDIVIYRIPRRIQIGDKFIGIKEQWQRVLKLIAECATNSGTNSVVLDTGTLARKLAIDAHMQEKQAKDPGRKQLLQIEYGVPNQEITNIYNTFKAVGKNLISVHHLTEEYAPQVNRDGGVESMPTGKRIMEGLNKTPQLMDVIIRTDVVNGEVVATYRKCGYNLSLVGSPTPNNPTWDSTVDQISMSLGGRIQFPRRKELTNDLHK